MIGVREQSPCAATRGCCLDSDHEPPCFVEVELHAVPDDVSGFLEAPRWPWWKWAVVVLGVANVGALGLLAWEAWR